LRAGRDSSRQGVSRSKPKASPTDSRKRKFAAREGQPLAVLARHRERALAQAEGGIGHDACLAGALELAQAVAGRAGAVGRVEGEQARLERRRLGPAARAVAACRPAALDGLAGARRRDDQLALGELERLLDGLAQARELLLDRSQAVHDHLDRVALVTRELGQLLDALDGAVHACAHEATPCEVAQQLDVRALAVAHQRRQEQHRLTAVRAQHLLHDALGRLGPQRQAAIGQCAVPARA